MFAVNPTNRLSWKKTNRHPFTLHPAALTPHLTATPLRYIRYARAIKPQINREAADKLVRMYKELRGEDAAPGTQSAYRITVRQLEALVRLSEAMARVYCEDVIKVTHVEEVREWETRLENG